MLLYNIPAAALTTYQDQTVTVRSREARALVEAFSVVPKEKLWSLQVLSLDCDADALLHLSESVPIDLVVDRPETQFSKLYLFAELPHKHPLRVTMRAIAGMTKAVKIAQALNFSVKLEIDQPAPPVAEELVSLSEYYLRGSTVSHPVEPFHSVFLSFFGGKPTDLWSLQEEDPAVDRYVTDDGSIAFSSRLGSLAIPEDQFVSFLQQHTSTCQEADECSKCEYFSVCQSYFKLPNKGYSCEHAKRIFALLNEAAVDLRQDEKSFDELAGSDDRGVNAISSSAASAGPRFDASSAGDRIEICEKTGTQQRVLSSFSMQRLDYRLEEFTRHSWTNPETKAVWEPRITKICTCIGELEWRSILEGMRACGLKSLAPDELSAFGDRLAPYGLVVTPLEKISVEDLYASSRRKPKEGEAFNYWCAVGRTSDVQLLQAARSSHYEDEVGRLLGYPSCCTSFFRQVWVEDRFVDTTWPMAQNTVGKRSISPTHLEIPEGSSCSVLLRWLGMRKVFHLPCSFHCQPSIELAAKHTETARAAGFHEEMDWLEEMLSWPIEWLASKGFAEIATPVGTISTVTDATADRYRVSYNVREVARFLDLEWYHSDNGFRSRADMDLAHEPIVKLAATTLEDTAGDVLDLGCGNGALLEKICRSNSNLVPWGIDQSRDRIAHAQLLTPRFADNFFVSDIFDESELWSRDRKFQLVILMLGRLTEVTADKAEELLRRVREHARNLLVYAYNDYGSLEELARITRVPLSDERSGPNVALARLQS